MPLESEFYEACARKQKKMLHPNVHLSLILEVTPLNFSLVINAFCFSLRSSSVYIVQCTLYIVQCIKVQIYKLPYRLSVSICLFICVFELGDHQGSHDRCTGAQPGYSGGGWPDGGRRWQGLCRRFVTQGDENWIFLPWI